MKYELLAPAGNPAKMKYAIEYGADAVYLGIPDFSLRVRINQFTLRDIFEAVEYAHERGKKVYVTLNIYAHNHHLETLPKYLKELKKIKPDAFIVSDPGIMSLVKKFTPEIPIHVSTQANVTNWLAAKFWVDNGATRIILGREVTLEQIKEMHKKLPKVELECFIHGAMCMSYSGRCILSAWLAGRSANLGDCTQPCRWCYSVKKMKANQIIEAELEEKERPNEIIPVEQDMNGTYIFNSKDLCLIRYMDELKKAGIVSFKIEGRAKSIHYLSNTVKAYRQALDLKEKDVKKRLSIFKKLEKELAKAANREFTNGFLFGPEINQQKTDSSHSQSSWEFVGEVIYVDNKIHLVKVHNALKLNDKVEVMTPAGENFTFIVKKIIDHKTGHEISEAHGGGELIARLEFSNPAPMMSLLRKFIKT